MSCKRSPFHALSAPAPVAEFQDLLRKVLPGASVTPEAGGVKAGNWWLECSKEEAHVTVEWRPGLGFGVSDPDVDSGYGEGPDEVFRDVKLAVRRVRQWLQTARRDAPSSWLRQLREVHGISQVELAERLKVNQAAVSRLENRKDLKVTTLLAALRAMGGRMRVVAHFKDCDLPVRLLDTEAGAISGWEAAEDDVVGELYPIGVGTPPRLNLLVLRSPDAQRLADFYSTLGLTFELHRHGAGPEHLGADVGGSFLEIYPLDSLENATSAVRLGFAVADVDKSYAELIKAGGTGLNKPSASQWGRRAVVRDIDGHKIELTEARTAV